MSKKHLLPNYGIDSDTSSDHPSFGFSRSSKRPKVYATRDFPEHCKPAKPLALCDRNYYTSANKVVFQKKDQEKVDQNKVNEVVFRKKDQEKVDQNKVKKTLNLFQEVYKQLLDEEKAERRGKSGGARRMDIQAAEILKKNGKFIHSKKRLGHIPGISVGDCFRLRAELAAIGLHSQYTSGIDYMDLEGKKFATSIVNSGRYENKAKTVDVFVYSGQGGHKGFGNKSDQVDQKLERGNLALVNSMEKESSVRVIHKCNDKEGICYVYDGLYVVKRYWQEKDQHGKIVFKFELHRVSGQEKFSCKSRKLKSSSKECCVVHDVSEGKENMQIRAVNSVDGEKPETFTYIIKVLYPEWFKKVHYNGCGCTNGCSNSTRCRCSLKNGGEIAYSEKGGIIGSRPVIYECGPSCKCPPSCTNRFSQRGPRFKLEIFKTESRGWGVRSRSYISSGSFVCEYVGKLVQIEDYNKRRYETGFTLDAKKFGNVGRFIGYSDSPNLFVQRVLFDHEDERMPHVMMFAAKNIPPLQELTCDYDHQVDRVCRFEYRL